MDARAERAGGVAGLPTGRVTFLFTDIEGSSALVEALGDAWPALLDRHDALLTDAIADAGGIVVNTEGDAVFAVFTDPAGAVRAAVAAQRLVAGADWGDGRAVRVRMGLHSGEGVRGGRDYAGLDVHRAARIAAAAHGGQVLLSAVLRERVGSDLPEGVTLRDLGEHGLRGITEPERLSQLVVPGLPDEFPPLRAVRSRSGTLPQQLSRLVGRGREVAEVVALLRETRIVTITGPGGTGKTRLALAAAEAALPRTPDGAVFVALSPVTDAALVPATVAGALGVREEPGRALLETLAERLAPLRVLLVLDNMEQLTEAAPAVGRLAAAGPGVRVLVTSRAPLRVSGEQEYPLDPLGLPDPGADGDPDALAASDAVALFVTRARERDPSFAATPADLRAIAAICTAVDGLPLAIELAASRLRLLSPAAILARMETALALLAGGARDRPERHQTLRATIDGSHELLGTPARALFRRLAVFRGSAALDAIDDVCGDVDVDALDALDELVDQSLVRRVAMPGAERFRMLHVIREYAAERLDESGEAREVRTRHVRWCRDLVARAAPCITGADQDRWLETLDLEHDNVRAALRAVEASGDPAPGLEIAADIWRYWQLRDHAAEGREWLAALLAMPAAPSAARARARARDALGSIVYWQGDYAEAEGLYARAAGEFAALGDDEAELAVRESLAWVASATGDWPLARDRFDAVLARRRARGDPVGIARVLGPLGVAMSRAGAKTLAREPLEEAIGLLEGRDEPWWLANMRAAYGDLLVDLGRPAEGLAALSLALRFYAQGERDLSGVRFSLAYISRGLARVGATEESVVLSGGADALGERLGLQAPPAIVGEWDARAAAVAAGLAPDTVARRWKEGRSMAVSELVARACDAASAAA